MVFFAKCRKLSLKLPNQLSVATLPHIISVYATNLDSIFHECPPIPLIC